MSFLEVVLCGRLPGLERARGCQGNLVDRSQRACVPNLSFPMCSRSHGCEDILCGISAAFVGKQESPRKHAFVVLGLVWLQTLVEAGLWSDKASDQVHQTTTDQPGLSKELVETDGSYFRLGGTCGWVGWGLGVRWKWGGGKRG